jgi:hypothetical protein
MPKLFEEVVDVPDIPFPTLDIDRAASEINNALKEAAYILIGLGVLAFQRAQVRRVELAKKLEGRPDSVSGQVDGYLRQARQRARTAGSQFADDVGDISRSMEDTLDPLRAYLLELARAIEDLVDPARQQIDEQIDRFEQSLPESARSAFKSFRDSASAQERAWRSAVGLDEPAPDTDPDTDEPGTEEPDTGAEQPGADTDEPQ